MFNIIKRLKNLYNSNDVSNCNDMFLPIIIFLKFIEFWPSKFNWHYHIRTWFILLFILIPFPLCQLYYIYVRLEPGNFLEILASNVLIIQATGAILKGYYMRYKVVDIQQLLKDVNCSKLFVPRNQQQIDIVKKTRQNIYNICMIFYISGFVAVPFIYVSPIIFHMPLEIDFPFADITIFPYYQFAFMWRIAFYMIGGIINICYGLLAASTILFIGSQIDCLADELDNLNANSDKIEDIEIVYENFHYCIEKHQAIVEFSKKFNKIYNLIILITFIGSFTLVLTLYELSLPNQSGTFLYIAINNGVLIDNLLYCWTGNEVAFKSNLLTFNACNSQWVFWNNSKKKELLIFMMRLQQPLQLFAGKIFPISLSTFLALIRTSYSYYAAMKQINAKDQQ